MRLPRTTEVRFRLEHHKVLLGALFVEVMGGTDARNARSDNQYVEVLKLPMGTYGLSQRFGQLRSPFARAHIA